MPHSLCVDCQTPGRFLVDASKGVQLDYYRCDRCGLVWSQDKPDPIAAPTSGSMLSRVVTRFQGPLTMKQDPTLRRPFVVLRTYPNPFPAELAQGELVAAGLIAFLEVGLAGPARETFKVDLLVRGEDTEKALRILGPDS